MIENPDTRQLIIAELDEYAHAFEEFNEDWNNLLERVLERMGFTINDDTDKKRLQQYLEDI